MEGGMQNVFSFFQHIFLIWKKEFLGYFKSPIAYVFIAVFLFFSTWLFLVYKDNGLDFFVRGQADMRFLFQLMPFMFIALVPPLTMRLWSEERKLGTVEILMTLPLRESEIVLGKFLAAWSFVAVPVILTLPLTGFVGSLGSLDAGPVIGGYLGTLFLGGVYVAIGVFVSGISRNQIISFIITVVLYFVFILVGLDFVLSWLYEADQHILHDVCAFVGFLPHFQSISRGVIDTKDLIYFASLIVFFLILNRFTIEVHKYS
jgi:ABC-2 type transport system permease protein